MTLRLRQAVLVAADLEPVAKEVQSFLGLAEPYHDPGVGEFGLTNAVFAVGDTFLEIVSPTREGTTAGRYLERRGGDAGYMAIFQVDDLATARQRIAGLGIRVVWQADLKDIAGTHLHPKDVPGAIVSIDWADPPGSWRWAGPDWIGTPKASGGATITGITVGSDDPAAAATTWAAVLGVEPDGPQVRLGGQLIDFVAGEEGISEIRVGGPGPAGPVLEVGSARITTSG